MMRAAPTAIQPALAPAAVQVLPEAGDFLASLGWSDGTEEHCAGVGGGGALGCGVLAISSRPWAGAGV